MSFLAPMQDITDAGFMRIIAEYGAPDFFAAEYFRIHEYFDFEPRVLEAVLARPAGKKVSAQFIGEDETLLARAAEKLLRYESVDMLDLNLGCPAPKIYRKNVGGGLLRDRRKVESVMRVLRAAWPKTLSVKMRLGFESDAGFWDIFNTLTDCGADFITIHGRTVRGLYREKVSYEKIFEASRKSAVPVIANGDIDAPQKALFIRGNSECAGVMAGRCAVRNPWIFRQFAEALRGEKVFRPTLGDLRGYVEKLWRAIEGCEPKIKYPDARLKKFLNFAGVGVDSEGAFLYKMRRAQGAAELLDVCDKFLTGEFENAEFNCAGYENLCPRPNHEK